MGRNTDDHVSEPLARGASIGRYVVLGLLGRGGMGEVYAAFDPELDRKVAVKLLRARIENGVSNSEGRQRTLREAQAIARLSHPNVVTVFDVGTFGEQVFIAMEFVDGHTASYWVQAQPRTWQEVMKVYLVAGRGLQAAHEKGLVHRDFKPENVMVARDGEVRVMDFGLAREIEGRATRNGPVTTTTVKFGDMRTDGGTIVLNQPKPEAPPVSLANDDGIVREMQDTQPSPGNADLFGARLTRTGAIMGTPAYMAPEQFFKAATDARSDQFSFCVTLYEALYGERPFPGNNIQTLVGNIVQGNIRPPPAGTKVPAWVRKILLRGLRPTPAERFPSMAELLKSLGKDPRAVRKKWALAAAAVLVPLALGFSVRQSLIDRRAACNGAADKLAGVWELRSPDQPEGPRQFEIHAAFMRSGKSYAAEVFDTVSRALTSYAQNWADMYKQTCEATQVHHDQSEEVLDLRMSCLQERLNGLHALTNVFATATGEVVENAISASNALATLDRCADVPALRAIIKPPEDRAVLAQVVNLRNRLADVKARFDAGAWKVTLKEVPALVKEARATGYQPLVAEALGLAGTMLSTANEAQPAEKDLVEAYHLADGSKDDELRAEVATTLVFVVGHQESRFEDALDWANSASAVLGRIGEHQLLHAWLFNNLGCAYGVHHEPALAVENLGKALAIKRQLLGPDHPDVGLSEGNIGYILKEAGRYGEALSHVHASIDIFRAKFGANHPKLAVQLYTEGALLNALNRMPEARRAFEDAIAIWTRELGSDAPVTAYALTGIGVSYLEEGAADAALGPLEQAIRIRGNQNVDPIDQAETEFALARALRASGHDPERSRRLAEEARSVYARLAMAQELALVDAWIRNRTGVPVRTGDRG